MIAISAAAVLLVATVVVADPSSSLLCPGGDLYCFNANSPAVASQVNHNFAQLKSWLEQKIGTAGTADVDISGETTITGNVTVVGPDNTLSLKAHDDVVQISGGNVAGNLHLESESSGDIYLNYYNNRAVRVGGNFYLLGDPGANPGTIAATNSALRVINKTGTAWVYGNIVPAETRIPPYWNSYNGAESNTGTLELGYLVLNDVLHLALMGGKYDPNLRLEVVDGNNNQVLYTVTKGSTTANFEYLTVNTSANKNRVVKLRFVDDEAGTGPYSWLAFHGYYVQ